MIKVNLLKDRTSQAQVDTLGPVGKKTYKEILSISSDGFNEPEINPLVKLLIMLVPVALMYLYEYKVTKESQEKVSKITLEVQQTEAIRDEKKTLVDGVNLLKAELDARKPLIAEFRKIGVEKLQGIKVLDQLQDLIPIQIWVTEVVLNRTQIDITGISTSDKELNVFQQNFEDSVFFDNILIYNSIETKSERGDNLISFRMRANVSAEVQRGG